MLLFGILDQFPANAIIDKAFLMKHDVIMSVMTRVKVVGNAKLVHAYTVHIPCSKQSAAVITKAGGKVIQ